MTDITKCDRAICPLATNCHRFTAPADSRQSYFIWPDDKKDDGNCMEFWDNDPESVPEEEMGS